jgi:hypothetical protein
VHRRSDAADPPPSGLPPLVADAEAGMRERSPLALLMMASGLIEVATPRPTDSWGGGRVARTDGPAIFESFAMSGWPGMAALAVAVATLHTDELLAARLRNLAAPNLGSGPTWLSTMGRIEVTDSVVLSDPLGDGENVVVSWTWPGGEAGTMVVYIDHNMGTIVKDAFALAKGASAVATTFERMGDRHIVRQPINAADARARIAEAIAHGERTVPPLQTDTWPTCRPVVEWLLRHMPEGGNGYDRPDWPSSRREQLLDEFVASSFGQIAQLTPAQVRGLAEPLVWFACDFGPGDPLRWSPVAVEIVLTDWYPRKVFGRPLAELRLLPDVLAGLVRFAHADRKIPADLTDDTLTAVGEWTDEFIRAIGRPGRSPFANATRLARVAAGFDPDTFDDDIFDEEVDDATFVSNAVDQLEAGMIQLVGGRAAYDTLDDAPLGDIPFDWNRIPTELTDAVGETLAHLDRWSIELFDPEVRTISRGVLAAVIAADPSVFKRSARTDALAAAILGFLLPRLMRVVPPNERRDIPWRVFTQKDLAQAVGVSASTIGNRAKTVSNVLEAAEIAWPSILHSIQRRDALRTKQLVADWRSGSTGL